MSNSFKKSINLGLGLLMYSREKVEELVEELIDKGEVAKKDAREFADDLVRRGEEQKEELKNLIQDAVIKALDNVNVARKEDLVKTGEIREIVREQIQQAFHEQGRIKNEDVK